jgi:hypothetical protein
LAFNYSKNKCIQIVHFYSTRKWMMLLSISEFLLRPGRPGRSGKILTSHFKDLSSQKV